MRYFGTNVKMNQTAAQTASFVGALSTLDADGVQLFVIPPFTSLAGAVAPAHAGGMWIGAQNLHWAPSGEFTGEVSGSMLRGLDVDLVLIGHAERRRLFGDDDGTVQRKVEAALANGLRVLLCVGDSAEERRCGAAADAVLRQLRLAVHGVVDRSQIIVAYEPVWAIGESGQTARSDDVAAVVTALADALGDIPLLYGGSVNAATAGGFAALPGIDGLFVGRAAWTPQGFKNVLTAATR